MNKRTNGTSCLVLTLGEGGGGGGAFLIRAPPSFPSLLDDSNLSPPPSLSAPFSRTLDRVGMKAEYEEEGIPWSHVDFSDNAEVLGLVESRMGIIAVLNEECVRPRGGDLSFVSKVASARVLLPAMGCMQHSAYRWAGPGKDGSGGTLGVTWEENECSFDVKRCVCCAGS